MIEIIILFFLCQKIGAKARAKGLPSGWWKFYTVAAWIGAEFLGLIFVSIALGFENLMTPQSYFVAIACAFGGYLFIHYLVEKAPDNTESLDDFGSDVE